MKKFAPVFAAVAILLVGLMLSGCLKSATNGLATATLAAPSFPVSTTQAASVKDILSATQTALAQRTIVATATAEVAPTEEQAVVEATATKVKKTKTAAPTEAPAGRPSEYALKQGEWPICIARRYDVNLGDFFAANGLDMESRPAVGTVLKIPATGNWDAAAHGARALNAHPATYTVAAGDTIYTIACHFGDVTPEQIAKANDLKDPYTVKAGTKLSIP